MKAQHHPPHHIAMRHGWLLRLIGKSVHDCIEDPKTQITIHKVAVVFWLVNMIVATIVFFAWPNFWLVFATFYIVWISLYSNLATDYGALSAAQASLHGIESREAASGSPNG